MTRGLILCAMVLTGLPLAARGEPVRQCTCRANGTDHVLGTTVCIRTSAGAYLAQCTMVLNNTSWKKVGDSCPQATLRVPDLMVGTRRQDGGRAG